MSSTSALKLFVYALDIVCALLALVLISFGIYVVVSYDLNEIGNLTAYGFIFLGAVALVILLWGYLSAWKENVCCTVTFVVFLWLIIASQFAVVFLLIHNEKSVASNLANPLEATWEEELSSPGAMSIYQNWFQCCGRGSPQDYIVNERLPPETCFRNHDKSKAENLIHTGCRVEFENYWLQLLQIFNILGCVLIGIELLISVISIRLCNSIRNDQRRSYF
ncbi:23 kDa integral membrane protein [Drosophila obscura]|uniref:23 kDa integral membrane protein n=1 Tax=Drosophila obscura TaxID=7282 RepID=UPI001BB2800F|nr:23 kDa integral membrane protein [Drosophila obscura]